MKMSRREILQTALASSSAGLLGLNCSNAGSGFTPIGPIGTVQRDLHLSVGHLRKWSAEHQSKMVLEVSGTHYPVVSHTPESKQRLLSAATAESENPSHYIENVPFSAEGPQSYRIGIAHQGGGITPILAGIHVPPPARKAGALAAAPSVDDDAGIICSPEDAAQYLVFHTPQVLTLDTEVARSVLAHMVECSTFAALVAAIEQAGAARTLEEAAQGISGWVVAKEVLDPKGQRIPAIDLKGDPVLVNGQQTYRFSWEPDPKVAAATNAVVNELMTRFHNDRQLEGLKYFVEPGVGSQPLDSPDLLLGPALTSGHDTGQGTSSHDSSKTFIFADQGRSRAYRKMEVTGIHAGKIDLEVTNKLTFGTLVTMRSYDSNGKTLKDLSRVVGYVPATFYPSPMVLLGPSKGEFAINYPRGATSIRLATISPAVADLGDADEDVFHMCVSALMASLFDVGVPCIFLAMGVGGLKGATLNAKFLKHVLKEVGMETVLEVVKVIVADLTNGRDTDAKGFFGVMQENLKEIVMGLLKQYVHFMGKMLVGSAALVFAEVTSEAVAIAATEAALPVAGQVIALIGIAQSVAQLAIQGVHLVTGEYVVASKLEPVHPLMVVMSPNSDEFAAFPPNTDRYEIALSVGSQTPLKFSGEFDPSRSSFSVETPKPIPVGGTLKYVMSLFAGGVAIANSTGEVPNETSAGQLQNLNVTLNLIPFPMTGSTQLTHVQKVQVTANERKLIRTSAAPTADDMALACDLNGGKVCAGLGITVDQRSGRVAHSFETSMSCGPGLATQSHVMSYLQEGAVAVSSLACGTIPRSQVVLGKGSGYLVAPVKASSTGENRLAVFALGANQLLPASLDPQAAVGVLRGTSLRRARLHPLGHLVALTEGDIEVLDLSRSLLTGRPSSTTQILKRGIRSGFVGGAVSVTPMRKDLGFLVLEQTTKRVQAMTFGGDPFRFWKNASQLDVSGKSAAQFLDVELDAAGNTWVLSFDPAGSAPAVYSLAVYNRDGQYLTAFRTVKGLSLSIDDATTIFVQNAENAIGPGGYAEPSISIWRPTK